MNQIDIFPWNDNFNTGLEKVDHQHQRLVDLINRLASFAAFGDDEIELTSIFNELIDYAGYHFDTEETIWHEYFQGDQNEVDHKQSHKSFVETINHLQSEKNQKSRADIIEDILDFLVKWLAQHILDDDRHLAHIVLGITQGMSKAEAKTYANEQMTGSNRVMIEIILSIYATLSRNTLQLMRKLAEESRTNQSMQKVLDNQERAELKIRNLSIVVEQSPESIIITDENVGILYVNNAFTKTSGYSSQDVFAKNPRILQSGETPPETYKELWETLHRGDVWRGEFVNRHKEGNTYIVRAVIAPIRDKSGEIMNYLAINQNITEQKEMEEKLHDQLDELRRWHTVTLGREKRVDELKQEVNALLLETGKEPRYNSLDSNRDTDEG